MSTLRTRSLIVLAALAAGLVAAAGPATASDAEELTFISAQVLRAPHAVTAGDDRVHLVYEIRMANTTRSTVTLTSVQARGTRGRVLGRRSGPELESRVRIDGGRSGLVLEPGWGGTVFMDVVLRRGQRVPSRLDHRVAVLVQPADASPPRPVSFTGVPTSVLRDPPVVVSPPLRGSRWVATTGCCPLNEHRGALLPLGGRLHAAQRFAIDFVRLTPDNRLFSGPIGELSSFRYFGARVRAVATGRVVRVLTGQPLQVPGRFPVGLTPAVAGGNHVVVRIAPRRYAFYAHMQSASIRVRVGDRVTRGQVIGLLGNSGNSQAPHLHFHMMDGPSPLASNGVPFVFTRFTGRGALTEEDTLLSGDPVPMDPRAVAGRHRERLPLDDQLLSFP